MVKAGVQLELKSIEMLTKWVNVPLTKMYEDDAEGEYEDLDDLGDIDIDDKKKEEEENLYEEGMYEEDSEEEEEDEDEDYEPFADYDDDEAEVSEEGEDF